MIPKDTRRLLMVSIVARVCSVRSKVYQSRQMKRNTLRSSFTVGSSRRYATMDTMSSFSAVLVGLSVHFRLSCWIQSCCWTVALRDPLPGSSLAGACTVPWGGHREFLVDLLGFSTVQYKLRRRIRREIPKPQVEIDQFRNGLARYSYSVVRVSVSCKGD